MAMSFQEAALLRKARRGDHMAALRLFERHGDQLYGFALGVTGVPTEAEEAVAAVAGELFVGQGNYLYTRAVLPQLLRRLAAQLRMRLSVAGAQVPPPPADGAGAEAWRIVGPALADRPLKERLAFYLWACTILNPQEAAELLDVEPNEYQQSLKTTLETAGVESDAQMPLPAEASAALMHKVEAALVDDPEGEGNAEAAGRRRRKVRRRASDEKAKGLPLAWLPLLAALAVIIAVVWGFERGAINSATPTPTATPTIVPTQWPVELDRTP